LRADAACEIAPVKIAFRTRDERAGLPIESRLSTANCAKYRVSVVANGTPPKLKVLWSRAKPTPTLPPT